MADVSGVDITLQTPGVYSGYVTRRLHIERIQIVPQRQPSVTPMPMVNKTSTGEPVAFVLDFGMISETIRLEGTIYDAQSEIGSPPEDVDESGIWASWPEIETIFRTSWRRYDMGIEPANASMLILAMDGQVGQNFTVLLGQITLTRMGAKPYWGFVMTLYVVKWS